MVIENALGVYRQKQDVSAKVSNTFSPSCFGSQSWTPEKEENMIKMRKKLEIQIGFIILYVASKCYTCKYVLIWQPPHDKLPL